MTDKDIEKMLEECDGIDMSHVKKDDVLAKAKQEMYFNTASAEEQKKKSSFPLLFTKKRFIPILAGFALMLTLCIGMIGLYYENFQTIYIDVNPSVALKLNRFERVIGVEYLNEDAKNLLSGTNLVGCNAQDALETVINACNSAGYVQSDSQIYISASAKEEKKAEELLQKLKGHAENMRQEHDETYAVNTYNAKKGEKKDFEKESLSPAKYNVIKEIIEEDDNYKIEDLRDKPMNELHKLKDRLEDDDRDDDDRDDDDDDDDFDRDVHKDNGGEHEREENPSNGKPQNKPNIKPNEMPDDDDDDDDKNGKPHKNSDDD